ncbi:hypothetical protein E2C01_086051 [Portunus trituberculatus]|uniref:Uncharacterized protein n=1 Tax=Portunus trituberculatus TaxID=210409 RepID=A0A5B7J2R1_PORTR|nr:hypothetical protein [Portunus trituberculatus]
MFSYVNTRDGVSLSVPTSYSFPMEVQTEKYDNLELECSSGIFFYLFINFFYTCFSLQERKLAKGNKKIKRPD